MNKEKNIVPKFNIGIKVRTILHKYYIASGNIVEYKISHKNVYYKVGIYKKWIKEQNLFATREEAEEELKKFKGEEK